MHIINKYNFLPQYPKCNEITLFLTTLILLLLLFSNHEDILKPIKEFPNDNSGFLMLILMILLPFVLLLLIYGAISSICHIFVKINIKSLEINCLLLYITTVNMFAGVASAIYITSTDTNKLLSVISIMNLINFWFLMLMSKRNIFDSNNVLIKSKNIKCNIITGSILICLIFIISNYIVNNNWIITLSLCLLYIENFSEYVNKKIIFTISQIFLKRVPNKY